MARLRAHFPEAAVGPVRLPYRRLDDVAQESPVLLGVRLAALAPAPVELEDEPVHVRLVLMRGAVADAHGPRPSPSVELFELELLHPAPAIHREEHLQVFGIA